MVADHPAGPADPRLPRLVVVMGVSGCGKSSVGRALAERIAAPFLDADDYHSKANVQKMSRGEPLVDSDRWPWLDAVGAALAESAKTPGRAVAACSALRRSYRTRLIAAAGEPVLFVHLDGPRQLLAERMAARAEHFMPTTLLDSQLAALEPPAADEESITVSIGRPVPELVAGIARRICS